MKEESISQLINKSSSERKENPERGEFRGK
jgi:hypothetical protein